MVQPEALGKPSICGHFRLACCLLATTPALTGRSGIKGCANLPKTVSFTPISTPIHQREPGGRRGALGCLPVNSAPGGIGGLAKAGLWTLGSLSFSS